jgi:BASS family bile acid:Na+ symporter
LTPSPVIAALWTEMSGGDVTISLTTALFSMLISIGIYPIVLYFLGLDSLNLSVEIFILLALSIFAPAIIALFLRDKENNYIPLKRKFKVFICFDSFIYYCYSNRKII